MKWLRAWLIALVREAVRAELPRVPFRASMVAPDPESFRVTFDKGSSGSRPKIHAGRFRNASEAVRAAESESVVS